MRIVSGTHKSRRINAPKNLPVRPTTDIAKEALFNIFNNYYYFDQISVLDLFAGIGSICLEFASRGTLNITAVDKHSGCINFLDKTINELDFSIQTIKSDVFTYLEKSNQKFDVIFADPPYDLSDDKFQQIVNLVFENSLLTDIGTLVVEHSPQTDLSKNANYYQKKKYGSSIFSFFEKNLEK